MTASYDPDERRDTPLALKLKERIRREGPIDVGDYMSACLQDPEHGYYRVRRPIGAKADFITAPEISQVFGELVGLWCAVVWQQMGSPGTVHLIEPGPGRGTMMRDALRAARLVPGFHDALRIWLVESDAALKAEQQATLAAYSERLFWLGHWSAVSNYVDDATPQRFDDLQAVPAGPTIVVANELLDAIPVQQIMRTGGRWHHRVVGLDAAGALCFQAGRESTVMPPAPLAEGAHDDDVFEWSFGQRELVGGLLGLRRRLGPVAALLVDYGHTRSILGDTLQAVERHRPVSALAAPGETDLTAQVDFEAFAGYCTAAGLAVDGPITQSEFLGRLGIVERASRLMASNPATAAGIEAGVVRLISPQGMGTRFKAIGVRSPALPVLPGFEEVGHRR